MRLEAVDEVFVGFASDHKKFDGVSTFNVPSWDRDANPASLFRFSPSLAISPRALPKCNYIDDRMYYQYL